MRGGLITAGLLALGLYSQAHAAAPLSITSNCSTEILELCQKSEAKDLAAQRDLIEFYRTHPTITNLNGQEIDTAAIYRQWQKNYRENLAQWAEKGDATIQYQLGDSYRLDGNYEPAVKWLYESANNAQTPNANARYQLGIMFYNGQGVKKDLSESWSLMELAATQGHVGAREFLAARQVQYNDAKITFGKIDQNFKDFAAANLPQTVLPQTGDKNGKTLPESKLQLPQLYRVEKTYAFADQSNSPIFLALKKSAQSGDIDAQKQLARRYAFGDGIPQNDAEARFWYSRAADSGDTATQIGLASLYYDGRGVGQNYNQAFIWFNRAAKAGDARALSYLAVMYDKGLGVPTDAAKARENYRAAADKGIDFAAFNAAVMCRDGVGGTSDLECAAKYFFQAAKAGVPEAEFEYALALRDGRGIGKNPTEAAAWMGKSANHGFVPAFYPFGLMLESGTGLAKSESEAFTWFTRAVNAKSSDTPSAYYEISLMYRDGRGVSLDTKQAIARLNSIALSNQSEYAGLKPKAAQDLLDIAEKLIASNAASDQQLAINLLNGLASNKSIQTDAALPGISLKAAQILAKNFADGGGFGKNITQYVRFADIAAQLGNVDLAMDLGNRYILGNEVTRNPKTAINYFTLLTKSSNDNTKIAEANYQLGIIYRDGDGVKSDFDQATKYFVLASNKGNKKAMQNVHELADQGNAIAKFSLLPLNSPERITTLISSKEINGESVYAVFPLTNNNMIFLTLNGYLIYSDISRNICVLSYSPSSPEYDSFWGFYSKLAENVKELTQQQLLEGIFPENINNKIEFNSPEFHSNSPSPFNNANHLSQIVPKSWGQIPAFNLWNQNSEESKEKVITNCNSPYLVSAFLPLLKVNNISYLISTGIWFNYNKEWSFFQSRKENMPFYGYAISFFGILQTIFGSSLSAITENDGSLIFASYYGILKMDKYGNISTLVSPKNLNGGHAYSVFRDNDGALIISAGEGGVIRYVDFQLK